MSLTHPGRSDLSGVTGTGRAFDRRGPAEWVLGLMGLGIGTAGTVMLSALAYLVGWVIAWILGGFRRTVP